MSLINLQYSKFKLFCSINALTQALAEAKKRIEELEKKMLENVPYDTAKEIGLYQEKMVSGIHRAFF